MKQRLVKIVLLLLFTYDNVALKAQPSEPGFPAAIMYHLPTSNLPVVNLPYFNNEELIAADTCLTCGEGFGIDANVHFDFWENSNFQLIDNSFERVEVYRVRIVSPTAKAIHVLFNQFVLKPDELMFIYSPLDTLRILGAFSQFNNKSDSTFITNFIVGNELIIEVNRRPKLITQPKGILKVRKFIHVYKDRAGFGDALNCHENVICAPWYNEWCNQIRSVVKLARYRANGNWSACSGAVINNTNNDFDPLILTAHHCTENGEDFVSWFAYFNHQSITCNPSTNGNDLMFISGIDVIADDNNAFCPDIALLRLREHIPEQYNVFFSGWNRRAWSSLPSDGRAIGIHHPAGDLKKISEGYRINPLLSSCVKVNWTTGYTEGGSSGSWYSGSLCDNGGVHHNAAVQNHCFYFLSMGGTQLGVTVFGIGIDKAAQIVQFALVNSLVTPTTTYPQNREAWISAAITLFGECSNEHKQTCRAWAACNIGIPCPCEPPPIDVCWADRFRYLQPIANPLNQNIKLAINEGVIIFPNPVSESLNINFNGLFSESLKSEKTITIRNVVGVTIAKLKIAGGIEQNTIDIRQYNDGTYFVQIEYNGKSYQQKFIKL